MSIRTFHYQESSSFCIRKKSKSFSTSSAAFNIMLFLQFQNHRCRKINQIQTCLQNVSSKPDLSKFKFEWFFSLSFLQLADQLKSMEKVIPKQSTIVKKYPSYRDHLVNGPWRWIEGKRKDDNAMGLWRIHNKIYDLTEFINDHPGGKYWLEITKVKTSFERPWQKMKLLFIFVCSGYRHNRSVWKSSFDIETEESSEGILCLWCYWSKKLFLHLRWKWILSNAEKTSRAKASKSW